MTAGELRELALKLTHEKPMRPKEESDELYQQRCEVWQNCDVSNISQQDSVLVAALIHQMDTINATMNLTTNLVKAILSKTAALDRNTVSRQSKIIGR